MSETQESISQWAEDTFGPAGSHLRVACRANEEMAELLRALSVDGANPKAAEEAADVAIVLYRLCARLMMEPEVTKGWSVYASSNFFLAAGANDFMGELLMSLGTLDDSRARCATRNVFQWLHFLAHRMGFDLDAEVDKKMTVNRAREWKLDGSGHGYHVREKAGA